MEGAPVFQFTRGLVNLAWRWPQGKVAKKARIPLPSLPVAHLARRNVISQDWIA